MTRQKNNIETWELQQQQANPLFQLKAVPLFNEQPAKKNTTENQRLGKTFYSASKTTYKKNYSKEGKEYKRKNDVIILMVLIYLAIYLHGDVMVFFLCE